MTNECCNIRRNECVERRYKELCQAYQCQVKIFAKPIGNLKRKLGSPDLMIFFTSTMSHKMVDSAMSEMNGSETVMARCRTSSMSALKDVLEVHTGRVCECPKKC